MGVWTDYERDLIDLDSYINNLGIPVDVDLARHYIEIVEKQSEDLKEKCKKITGGISPTQVAKLLEWVNQQRPVKIPNLQTETLNNLDLEPGTDLHTVISARKMLGMASVKKLPKILDVEVDGRLHQQFIVFGALTGRWAARLVQPMNFKKPDFDITEQMIADVKQYDFEDLSPIYDNLIPIIGSSMRHLIAAKPGNKLYIGDFSNIESRLLFWAAGDDTGYNEYKNKVKLYERMAAFVFGIDENEVAKDSLERFCGKQAVLSCGYGCGPDKFQTMCAGYGQDIDIEIARKCVKGFREKYHKVKSFWRDMDKAAENALFSGKPEQIGPFTVESDGNGKGSTRMVLPSGRRIYYPEMRYGEGDYGRGLYYKKRKSGGMFETYTYGAKLVENGVQAMAFDVTGNGMIKHQKNGFFPFMNIHDEVIGEVPEECDQLDEFKQLMEQHPWWLPDDFPLASEVGEYKNYGKEILNATIQT